MSVTSSEKPNRFAFLGTRTGSDEKEGVSLEAVINNVLAPAEKALANVRKAAALKPNDTDIQTASKVLDKCQNSVSDVLGLSEQKKSTAPTVAASVVPENDSTESESTPRPNQFF